MPGIAPGIRGNDIIKGALAQVEVIPYNAAVIAALTKASPIPSAFGGWNGGTGQAYQLGGLMAPQFSAERTMKYVEVDNATIELAGYSVKSLFAFKGTMKESSLRKVELALGNSIGTYNTLAPNGDQFLGGDLTVVGSAGAIARVVAPLDEEQSENLLTVMMTVGGQAFYPWYSEEGAGSPGVTPRKFARRRIILYRTLMVPKFDMNYKRDDEVMLGYEFRGFLDTSITYSSDNTGAIGRVGVIVDD